MAASTRAAPKTGKRDSELCALGYRVIRFWSNDVINLDGVLETIESELEKWPLTPPSPRKRGEGHRDGGRLF